MNLRLNTILATGLVLITVTTSAQKKNETSAAVEFKNNYQPAMASGDFAAAKKALTAAKEYIDLAAANPETAESPKTLWLKGEIYSSFLQTGLMAKDTAFAMAAGNNAFEVAAEAFKKGYDISNKYDSDIKDAVENRALLLNQVANTLYDQKMYSEAGDAYLERVNFYNAISIYDTVSVKNAAICYNNAEKYEKSADLYLQLAEKGNAPATNYALAAQIYTQLNQYEKAGNVIAEARKKYPLDKDLINALVRNSLASGDNDAAEKALNEALAADPNNKQLHYIIGSVYSDMKLNNKAEDEFNKALALDPNYDDALYQLGAHLVNWASDVQKEAGNLKYNDPRYDKMMAQANTIYERALDPLEKYVEKYPNDQNVLLIISKIYRNLDQMDKAAIYEKKLADLKNK